MTCPSTHQLLRSSPGYSGPNMSSDFLASPEYLSGLARVGLTENDMKTRVSTRSKDELGNLVKTFCIPANLHPHLPDHALTMDCLPDDTIGVYSEYLGFFDVRIPFSTFLLFVLKNFKDHISQLVHLGLNKVVSFEVVCRDLDEVAAAQLDPRLVKKSNDLCKGKVRPTSVVVSELNRPYKKRKLRKRASEADLKNSLERTGSTLARAVSALTPHLGKRLGPPPSSSFVVVSKPLQIGGSVHAFTFEHDFSRKGSATGGFAEKPRAEDVRCCLDPLDTLACGALAYDSKYDQIPMDDFAIASRGEEIDLTLFPLASAPYVIPYPFDGNHSPPYSRKQWDGPHALEDNIPVKEIFKDLDVCKRLNKHFSNLVNRKSRTQEKIDRKTKYVKELRSKVTALDKELEKAQGNCSVLAQENRELCSHNEASFEENELALERSKSQEYKDIAEGLRAKVTRALQVAKINYPPMEKLALALVHAARQLRRYFQGHIIKVITDKPINQILSNREATRRMAKWVVELEAYGIQYAPRNAIKGQVLADFLADTMVEDSPTHARAAEHEKLRLKERCRKYKGPQRTRGTKNKTCLHINISFSSKWSRRTGQSKHYAGYQNEVASKRRSGVEELPNVLWAHRTTPKTSNRETPFSLTYKMEAVIPAEIGMPIRRIIQGLDEENEEALWLNLNLLEER
nr:reverse transcriptase domain-containing protein [Tanacetum cinerariifolium]